MDYRFSQICCLKMPLACPVEIHVFFLAQFRRHAGDATGLPSGVSRFESCHEDVRNSET